MKAALYIISNNVTLFELKKQEIVSIYHGVQVLKYPQSLFWSLLIEYKHDIKVVHGGGYGDYFGDHSSFLQFGALPMLVPVLEVLQMGFNAIFFDIDLAFIDDPIPHLLRGDADLILAPEIRTCTFPSLAYDTDWSQIEPNTGAMFIRSANHTIKFFKHFLQIRIDI